MRVGKASEGAILHLVVVRLHVFEVMAVLKRGGDISVGALEIDAKVKDEKAN